MHQAQIVSLLNSRFKEKIIPYFHNDLFQEIIAEETVPNIFNKTTIALITKPDKDITRNKNY